MGKISGGRETEEVAPLVHAAYHKNPKPDPHTRPQRLNTLPLVLTIRPSFRLPVDGTAVFTAVRRRYGMLGSPVAQGRDGTVVRPSVRPTVLDGYGDDPYGH
ncbi:hypothetical protein DFH09DRAFT_1069136 [Mycena vulgaris]|nr:hypothetical protein DFH09DRAFT_1069136 [Mycena vulgaris]